MTSLGVKGINIWTNAIQKWDRPGVWKSKRHLLASRYRCECSMETFRNLVIKSKSVIRSSSVTRSQFCEMSVQWRMSLYMVMFQNVVLHLGEGDFIMFDEIHISAIELPGTILKLRNMIYLHFIGFQSCTKVFTNHESYQIQITV